MMRILNYHNNKWKNKELLTVATIKFVEINQEEIKNLTLKMKTKRNIYWTGQLLGLCILLFSLQLWAYFFLHLDIPDGRKSQKGWISKKKLVP